MRTLDEWNHKWFGVWREYGPAFKACPSILDFVHPVTALLELWIASVSVNAPAAHFLAAAIALGLMVLGPGAWSVDARLFGRRRISITDR